MNVKIFFDGQNFYRSLLRYDESIRVDYDRLAAWITQAVAGPTGVFCGAYYYVGVSSDAPPLVEGFLKGLELRPGYFVRREPRVRRTGHCSACGADHEYTTEKRVDTRLVAELIQYAANGAFDAAVLVSGDDDFVPAVEAVNALGKRVWVATWSSDELSSDLRVRCFGQVWLSEGIGAFRVERPRIAERERLGMGARMESRMPPRAMRLTPAEALEHGLAELQRAQARLPHVSRGYFVTRWRSHLLPPAGQEREQLVQQLIEADLAEEFELSDPDGRLIRAIRVKSSAVA